MAQDGSHGHQDTTSSNERSSLTAVNFLGPAENNNGGSRIGSPVTMDAGKGKQVIPDAIQGGEHGSPISGGEANSGRSGGKNAGNGLAKGESSMAAEDDGNLKVNIIIERERRRKMKGMYNSLLDLMPHVPKKVDQVTLVDETINFIKFLEHTKDQLEKKKEEQVLERARQAAAASSMSMPRTAHGMAAMADSWDPLPQLQPAAGPHGFQTWSAPNVVLSVLTNDEAVINICAPKRPHMLTLITSVLSKYKIDVTSMQVVGDTAESLLTINTRVNGTMNMSPEEIYKLAVSEIVVRLSS